MLNRSLNSLIYALLLFAGLAYVASTAHAGEVASCSVGGGTLAFGNYQPSTGNRTTAGSVQLSCTCRGNNETLLTGSTFIALGDAFGNYRTCLSKGR